MNDFQNKGTLKEVLKTPIQNLLGNAVGRDMEKR